MYSFLKIFVTLALKLFFRKWEINGYQHIPKNTPLIFVANHQGTFMDAILIICSSNLQIASLSRADIFKNPIIRKLLTMLMMVPIYRPRDQVDIAKKNAEAFRSCYDLFKKNGAIIIFPEGNNGLEWHLRSLKKGCARLGLSAEAANDFNLNLHIVPVGIHYEKHTGFQKKVMVNFGIPIKVVDYKTVYEQNSAKGIKQLITAVRTCIRKNMLHIANLKYYDEQVLAMKLMEHDKGVIFYKKQSQLQWLKQSQNTLNLIEQFKINDQHNYEQLIERIKEYRIQLKHLGINNQSVAIRISLGLLLFKFILLFFLSPLWLWAVLNCGVAYLINRLLFKMFKPPVFFWGSLKFAFGFLLSSFIFLLQTIVFYFVFRNIGFAIIYFVSLPFLGIFWYRYNIIVIKFVTQVKLNRLADSRVFNNLIRLQRDLISRLTSLET